MPTLTLAVRGMRTPACEERVEAALRRLPGVYGVVADSRNQRVAVDFEDDEVATHTLVEAVESLGYAVTLAG